MGTPFTLPMAYYGGTINAYNDPSPAPLEFDILVKVGNRDHPFKDTIDFIDNTLRNNAFRLQISPRTVKVNECTIHFTFTNGIATTLTVASEDMSQPDVLRIIRGDSDNKYKRMYYSTNLAEKQVDLMKQQKEYAHRVCRLAKYWYQNMDLDQCNDVIGGALLFELLAVSAVLEEESKGHGREAMLRAFNRIAEQIENLDNLSLGFEREFGKCGQWRVKNMSIVNNNNILSSEKLPRLTEPNNPKLNILHGMNNKVIEAFKANGKLMRERLANLVEKQEYVDVVGGESTTEEEVAMLKRKKVVIDFEALFGPDVKKEKPTEKNDD